MALKFLVINGPNINMLGIREPEIYGNKTYSDLVEYISDVAKEHNVLVSCFQSNHEGAIVDKIQEAYNKYDGIIINPAAYTHTSIAILDAIKAVGLPTVEVHLSKVNMRESYRRISYVKEACIETFQGFGFEGYRLAIEKLISIV